MNFSKEILLETWQREIDQPRLLQLANNVFAVAFTNMKLIPAFHVLKAARDQGILREGSTIVETTSGSFGLALAVACKLQGYALTIVSDPVIDELFARKLTQLGARIVIVEKPFATGGYQRARLAKVEELLAENEGAFWPRQYDNPTVLDSYAPLARHLVDSLGSIDALVGTVGTGGSMCGTVRALRESQPSLYAIGVDTVGSVLFGQNDQRRLLRGLGSSIIPGILDHSLFDEVHWVPAAEAFYSTRRLYSETGIYRGPTSGAAQLVADWWARRHPEARVVVLFPDEGARYERDVYSDAWLNEQGFEESKLIWSPQQIERPLEAPAQWSYIHWRRAASPSAFV
jgi:cysteine synthase A